MSWIWCNLGKKSQIENITFSVASAAILVLTFSWLVATLLCVRLQTTTPHAKLWLQQLLPQQQLQQLLPQQQLQQLRAERIAIKEKYAIHEENVTEDAIATKDEFVTKNVFLSVYRQIAEWWK